MKLARITHDRCDEYAATTYLMIPDDWDEEMLDAALDRAGKAYDWAAKEFRETSPQPSPVRFREAPGDMTISQYRELEIDLEQARKEWDKKRSAAQRNFGYWLHAEIPGSQYLIDAPALTATINWGHQHGRGIEYGDEAKTDLEGSAKRFSID